MTFTNLFLAAIGNTVLIYLVKLSGSLASSLSGGGANFGGGGGVGSAAAGARNSAYQSGKEAKMIAGILKSKSKPSGEDGGSIDQSKV